MLLNVGGCTVYAGGGYVFSCSSTKDQLHSVSTKVRDKDPDGSKVLERYVESQGCIFRLTCSHPELTKDHVPTSAYVKIFRTIMRKAVNKSV